MAFLVNVVEILDDFCEALEEVELANTVRGVVFQTKYAAAGAAVGGVLGGPLGALIGTTVGGVVGYASCDPYKNIFDAVKSLSYEQKKRLLKEISNIVGSLALVPFKKFISVKSNREKIIELFEKATKK